MTHRFEAVLQFTAHESFDQEAAERWFTFLTDNAASELRARGVNVEHKRIGRRDYYRLGR